jgi:transitional endoplasmic reticulum ATPase
MPATTFSATVDHTTTDISAGARLTIRAACSDLKRNSFVPDQVVRIRTETGRSILGRLAKPGIGPDEAGVVRIDRFMRQALKAHLNENVTIEPIDVGPATRVELLPAVDVSLAHDLLPHLKKVLVESRTPLSVGAVLYIPFPNSNAGTTYEVHVLPGGPGVADESTEVALHFHDTHLPDGAFDVTFEDVGGLGRQVKLLRELTQLPLKFPHVYRHLGINPPRGVILYGPPGSGKTHLARAVANEVEAKFYYINGPDVIGTYAGETEGTLRRMFGEASHHAPSLIFIDELDALAPKRGETGAHSDTRVVTQLLSLMDGLTRIDAVMVIGTTNRLNSVDQAFRRPGRFDREIFVGPPDAPGRREILNIHTREMPLTDEALHYLGEIAKRTHGFVGADLMELCREAGLSALRRSTLDLKDHRVAFKISPQDLRVDRKDFDAALTQTRPSALRETLVSDPNASWEDIGGLPDIKKRLQEIVERPLRDPELLSAMGLTPHVGVLLHGPSGAGKTLLAKAIARECAVNFIAIDGPELFTKWLGESEEGVRHIFRIARQVAPTVVFFDQLDAIAPIRGDREGSMTTERVVNQLLAELDGLENLAGVVVIAATNRVDLVDPSMLRPGRFGIHLHVPIPDKASRRDIARIHLKGAPFADDTAQDAVIDAIAANTDGFSGAGIRLACDEAKRLAIAGVGFARPAAPTVAQALQAVELAASDSQRLNALTGPKKTDQN